MGMLVSGLAIGVVSAAACAIGWRRTRRARRAAAGSDRAGTLLLFGGGIGLVGGLIASGFGYGDWRIAGMIAAERAQLLTDLRSRDMPTRCRAAYELGRHHGTYLQPLRAALADPDAYVRGAAAWALGRKGPAAIPAVPDLARLLEDPEEYVQGFAANALVSLGTPARASLRALLATGEPRARRQAALGLVGFDRENGRALLDALEGADPAATRTILWAIGTQGAFADFGISVSLRYLDHGDAQVRWMAAWAADQRLPEGDVLAARVLDACIAAVPDCLAAANDPDPVWRRCAVQILVRSAVASPAIGQCLVAALRDPETRDAALGADWARLGGAAAADLVAMLREPELAPMARGALRLVGLAAVPALRALQADPAAPDVARALALETLRELPDAEDDLAPTPDED